MVLMLINKIKRGICFGLACLGLLGFAMNVQAKIIIFACEPEWAALALELGKDHISVTSATHAKQDPHHIEARPSLIAAARKANLVIGTGAELEDGWLPMVLQKANNAKILKGQIGYLMFADFVSLKKHHSAETTSRIDRAMGDIHASGNPHIQLDPRVFLVASKVLAQRLGQLDPEHAAVYQENYLGFKKEWENKLQQWAELAAPLKGLKIVAYHDNWVYLNDWLGLVQTTTLEPKPGIPPSAAYLKTILLTTQKNDIKAILRTPYEPSDAVKWLSQKTNIPVIELPFTVGGNQQAKTLAAMFDDTLQQLLRLKK
jgi:zinc/manganese transport system substrate-binding protein